MKWLIIYCNWD